VVELGPDPDPDPDPEPDPDPTPGELWGLIIEETEQRTPEQAALWSELTRDTTPQELLIVDQDSTESLARYQEAAAEFVDGGHAWPVLLAISAADGSVVDVSECPATAAEIKQELGL